MNKYSKLQYALIGLISLIAGIVVMAINLNMLNSYEKSSIKLDDNGRDIVARAAELAGDVQYADKAEDRIESGLMTVSDYCINSLTSAAYLSNNVDDATFASDLCYVVNGNRDTNEINSILEDLDGVSRQYVINEYLSDEESEYASNSDIDEYGSTFTNCYVSKTIGGVDGVTIGIREVAGNFSVTGDEVRTDFFVDGVLYQGNLTMTEVGDGVYDFIMAWDTAGVDSGYHSVQILLRSSDGRGMATAGGDIFVPSCQTLENFSVSSGSLNPSGDSWYTLDAGENHAFVNFVDLSDDIKVTLYDVYGNVVGTNDLANSEYEVLRGYKQDLDAISEETGINGVSNVFYIRVGRGENCENLDSIITYKMVQSLNVVRYDGNYMAVLDDVGAVPTPLPINGVSSYSGTEVRLKGEDGNIISVDFDSCRFLPINGYLTEFYIHDAVTGKNVPIFPEFDKCTENYGYFADGLTRFTVDAVSQEGYCSSISITNETNTGINTAYQGQIMELADGENKLTVTVTSFTGATKSYTFYILNGDDNGDFAETTMSQFPDSYGSGLWLMHSLHPNYIFRPYNTGLDYYDVLANEDSGSRSLASDWSHPNWVKPDSPVYDGGGWRAAKTDVVNYFLDPRSFLEPEHIFMFELLSFDPTVHTVEGVRSMIAGSFMDTTAIDYGQIIYDAGEIAGVSPYFLASRILQEMGYSGQSLLCTGTLPGYEGIYNFYNIGSIPNPDVENGALINGALYAMYGRSREPNGTLTETEQTMRLPWDNVEDAIVGGAIWIASGYTEIGQDTLYFQKFDVVDNDDGLYQHQYAQNISMAYTEGARYFSSYSSINMLNQQFVFVIPVYENMPEYYGYVPAGS